MVTNQWCKTQLRGQAEFQNIFSKIEISPNETWDPAGTLLGVQERVPRNRNVILDRNNRKPFLLFLKNQKKQRLAYLLQGALASCGSSSPAVRRPGCAATWLCSDLAAQRPGCAATWLRSDPAVRRPGCAATRLRGDPAAQRSG